MKKTRLLAILAFSISAFSASAARAAGADGKCSHLPTVTQRVECIKSLSTKPSPSSPASLEVAPASSEKVRVGPGARNEAAEGLRPTAHQSKVQRVPSAGDTACHTGPRGGTYTITASGRKNYSGC